MATGGELVNGSEKHEQKDTQSISKELKVFRDMTPTMITAFGQNEVLNRLAIACFSSKIIEQQTYESVTEVKHTGEAKRTQDFLMKIYQSMKNAEKEGRLKDADDIKLGLAKTIRDEDSTYEHIAKGIEKCKDASDFLRNIIHFADAIHGGLLRISTRAMSVDLIPYNDHTHIADSSGENCELRTHTLFDALDRKFQTNPQYLRDKFIPLLRKDMDDTSNIAVRLLEKLTS